VRVIQNVKLLPTAMALKYLGKYLGKYPWKYPEEYPEKAAASEKRSNRGLQS